MSIVIRPGTAADADAIAKLEQSTFSDSWSAREIKDFLADVDGATLPGAVDSYSSNRSKRITFIAEDEASKEFIGFIMVMLVAGEAQIYNLAVIPEYRRNGVGGSLLDRALEKLKKCGTEKVFLEVRVSNDAARALYDARGFREVFIRKGYYRQPTEDGLILQKNFSGQFSL